MAGKRIFSSGSNSGLFKWLVIALVVIIADQISKFWAVKNLVFAEPVKVCSFWNWRLVYNEGAAFSFLSGQSGWQRWFFTGIAIAAVLVIFYLLRKNGDRPLFCFALALILGGAAGNLIDRFMYGHVVDFIDWYIGRYHWPTFNIADCGVTVGAVLYVLDELRRSGKKRL